MIVVEGRHYNINRVLLVACGLWFYKRTKLQYVQAVFIIGITVPFVVYQLITLFSREYNFKVALRISSFTLPIVLGLVNFNAFLLNMKEVKQMFDQIYEEWNLLNDSKEIEILEKYGSFTRRLTMFLLLYNLFSWFTLVLIQFIPSVITDFATRNSSVSSQNDVALERLDREKYIYVLISFMIIIITAATISMLLAYMQHICAMLKITCYRIEHSLDRDASDITILRKDCLMCQKLISAVDIQRRATKFMEYALSSFKHFYLFLIGISILSLAANLLQALQTMVILDNVNDLMLSVFYIILHILYFFLMNYGGQEITDHSANVFRTLYSIQWYMTPVHVQKLILFLMLKNTKNYGLVLGGIYVASLEGFITLTSMTISYFMVVYSTQWRREIRYTG